MSDFDPFQGGSQGSRVKAFCRVFYDGLDVTDRLNPYLISLRIINRGGQENSISEAHIELDDRDAKLPIPVFGSPLEVWLGWSNEGTTEVFTGWIDSIESGFGRKQGGRRLWVDGTNVSNVNNGKTPMSFSMGEGAPPGAEIGAGVSLGAFLGAAAAAAGYSMSMASSLGGIQRDYWSQQNESFHNLASRVAKEHGGFLSFNGTSAIMLSGDGMQADGTPFGAITATWGLNLIGWRLKPFVGRPQYGGVQQDYYKVAQGLWSMASSSMSSSLPFGMSGATAQTPAPAPNSQNAGQINDGTSQQASNYQGGGWVLINGEPSATPLMDLVLSGARPGVDGTWKIMSVEHDYSRSGFLTRLEVNFPNFQNADGSNAYVDMGWPQLPKAAAPPPPKPAGS